MQPNKKAYDYHNARVGTVLERKPNNNNSP